MSESVWFRLVVTIFAIYILLSIYAICCLHKLRALKEEAARRITPSDYDLWSYLLGAQDQLQIPKQYRLDKDVDRAIVKRIIEDYKIRLSTAYFKDNFYPTSTKQEQTNNVYFMLSLFDYFDRIKTHDIPEHQLEEFPLVYYKAYYITYLFCKNSPISNPTQMPNWMDYLEKHLLSELEKRTS